ncbi:YihY/virulence factor BrkB family protein [Pseudooceanicola sp. HF7]|uniref:YihY/virulence factor BrkB family protein n=1 Tax=Pseudooceanicola sp. HF7 TaxID=2721560 RepID=UPI00143177D0|nr:YihY/virulence factor BrkB family protein [Pseudooceanicola sp. HF7]NIZ11610.1 YihY/virulence factor BrkB family protein [Pseudooceanicola sp. HF7]
MTLGEIWHVCKGMMARFATLNMGLIAAGVAFYSMLALFPAMAALVALWGMVADPQVVLEELQLVDDIIPTEIYSIVENQVVSLTSSSGSTLGWAGALSLLLAIWSARSGVAALILGLNAIHGESNRTSLRHYLTAIVLTVALIGVGIVTLASVVVVPVVVAFVPLGTFASILVEVSRWAAAIAAIMVGLSLVYRYGPNNRGERLGWLTPGAGLVVVLWAAGSFGFGIYLSNFANYNEVYGSLGAAVAMLFWLYISAFLVLLGAVLNIQLREDRQRSEGVSAHSDDSPEDDAEAVPAESALSEPHSQADGASVPEAEPEDETPPELRA